MILRWCILVYVCELVVHDLVHNKKIIGVFVRHYWYNIKIVGSVLVHCWFIWWCICWCIFSNLQKFFDIERISSIL